MGCGCTCLAVSILSYVINSSILLGDYFQRGHFYGSRKWCTVRYRRAYLPGGAASAPRAARQQNMLWANDVIANNCFLSLGLGICRISIWDPVTVRLLLRRHYTVRLISRDLPVLGGFDYQELKIY